MQQAAVDSIIRCARSWNELSGAINKLPSKAPGSAPDKGKVFERLTQLYLQSSSKYRTKLKHVWHAQRELPERIRRRLGAPKTDEGIDLIAETFEGHFWSIQCKYKSDNDKAVTVKHLATFANLTFNHCKGFATALVVHTSTKPIRKRKFLGSTTEVGLSDWLSLESEDWGAIHQAIGGKPKKPKARGPRPHQKAAIRDAVNHFKSNQRGRLIMPCGTGKSLTAFWIAQKMNAQSILVVVPSLSLIKQSITDWTREFLAHGEVSEWLCVCSDESTGRLEKDEFVAGVYDLGIETTTDPSEIGAFVNGGAKLVHPGGAKLVHLTLCGTRCWGVVPVVHRRDPRCFV